MKGYLSIALLGICLIIAGCGDAEERRFRTTLALINSSGGVSTVFNSAEPITMELSVTNLRNSPQTLSLSSPQTYEFIVARKGETELLWWWSNGKGFAAVIVDLYFTDGETKSWQEIWDQTDFTNTPVGIGNYAAQGFMWTVQEVGNLSTAETGTRSAPVSFTIK